VLLNRSLAVEISFGWREERVLVLWQQEDVQQDRGHQDPDEAVRVVPLLVEELVRLGVVVMRGLEGQHHLVQQEFASWEL
jgi:hypothetical protein